MKTPQLIYHTSLVVTICKKERQKILKKEANTNINKVSVYKVIIIDTNSNDTTKQYSHKNHDCITKNRNINIIHMIPGLMSVPNKGYMNIYEDNTNSMYDVMNEQTKDWSNHSGNNNTAVNKDKNEVFEKRTNTEHELNILNSLIASKYNDISMSNKHPTNVQMNKRYSYNKVKMR